MNQVVHKLVARLFRHPTAFLADIFRRFCKTSPEQINVVHSWDDAIVELQGKDGVVLYADGDHRARLVQAGLNIQVWLSDRLVDQMAGAQPTASYFQSDSQIPGGFLVANGDVSAKYVVVLLFLERRKEFRPVAWVGGPFEFVGSAIPVPKEVDEAKFHLYNHFADYFGVKDPLMVQVRVQAPGLPTVVRWYLLRARNTLSVKLSELSPNRTGAAVVEFSCTHPILTRGRHNRWRVWADLTYKNSLTSLHGSHDYGPSRWTESRLSLPELQCGKLFVTFPNYKRRLSSFERSLRWGAEGRWKNDSRDSNVPVEVRNWSISQERKGFAYYNFFGHGDSFWFNFGTNNNLISNHQVSVEHADLRVPLTPEVYGRMGAIVDCGFVLNPHYLPSSKGDGLQWGFSFASSCPRVEHLLLFFFDGDGKLIVKTEFQAKADIVWFDDLCELVSLTANAVVVAPDWQKQNVNPCKMNFFGHLFVRDAASGDIDATEFQNCWRNNGVQIDEQPHWIHPSKAVNARTHLIGRVEESDVVETTLLLAFGSGRLDLSKSARCRIEVIRNDGETISQEIAVSSFTHREIRFRDLFPAITTFLDDSVASCRVSSIEADLNGQIVTRLKRGGVSLQHMWGY